MNKNTCTNVNKLLKEISVTNCCVLDCRYLDCTIFFFVVEVEGPRNGDLKIHDMTHCSLRDAEPCLLILPLACVCACVCLWVCVSVRKADWCQSELGGISDFSQIQVEMQWDSAEESRIDLLSLFTNSWLITLPSRVVTDVVLWQLRFMESFNYLKKKSAFSFTQLIKAWVFPHNYISNIHGDFLFPPPYCISIELILG